MGLLVMVPAACVAPDTVKPKVVRDDFGGPLNARYEELQGLKAEVRPVQIRGKCASSCTLYLGLPQACVSSNAWIGFHGPASPFRFALPKDEFEKESRKMASFYPPRLAEWFISEGRHKIIDDLTWLRGSELESYGVGIC